MATTPNLSLHYPALTDSPNVPRDIKALADDVDTKMQLRAVSATSDVAAPYAGQIVFNLTTLRAHRYTGTAWVTLNPNMPACVLNNDTAFGVSNLTDTLLPMTVVSEQTTIGGQNMGATGSPGTITIREAGLYTIGARGQWGFATTGEMRTAITLNSTGAPTRASTMAYNSRAAAANSPQGNGVECTNLKRFAVGDVLRVWVAQSSGATLFLEGGPTGQNGGGLTAFWAFKVRD